MSVRTTYAGGAASVRTTYATQPPPPAAPATLTATAISATRIDLSWASVPSVTSYRVYRITGTGTPDTLIATVSTPTTTYSDTTVAGDTQYTYAVTAVNGLGESAQSPTATATTPLLSANAYWTMDAVGGLTDIVGGKVLTPSGVVTDQTGIIDGAKGFGGSQWLDAANDATFHLRAGFGVALWVYPTVAPNGSIFIGRDPITGANREWYFLDNSSPLFGVATSTGVIRDASGGVLTLNAWNHLVGTFDGVNARLYLNGALVGTSAAFSGTIAPGYAQPLRIGASTAGTRRFSGRIDEVGIFHTTLSLSDVQALYNAGAGRRP